MTTKQSALPPTTAAEGEGSRLAPGVATSSSPSVAPLSRCRRTLQLLDQPLAASNPAGPTAKSRRRPRCIHPAGHWGPCWFGEAK